MLSVCIPVYNYNIKELVNSLQKQAKIANVVIEILVSDDCSTIKYNNKALAEEENINYIEQTKNLGRSRNRNQLAEKAKYDYLLFLDCDSELKTENFLTFYIASIVQKQKVVCGGTAYTLQKPDKKKELHWKYGTKIESKPVEERKKFPNKSFSSFNFLIYKKLFLSIKFNEKLTKYGHEDTLFGFELKQKDVKIEHINNPLIHRGVEENKVFLKKTKIGIDNLIYVLNNIEKSKDFFNDIKLLNTFNKYKGSNILKVIKLFSGVTLPIIEFILVNVIQSITLFNIYKITYLSKKCKNF